MIKQPGFPHPTATFGHERKPRLFRLPGTYRVLKIIFNVKTGGIPSASGLSNSGAIEYRDRPHKGVSNQHHSPALPGLSTMQKTFTSEEKESVSWDLTHCARDFGP